MGKRPLANGKISHNKEKTWLKLSGEMSKRASCWRRVNVAEKSKMIRDPMAQKSQTFSGSLVWMRGKKRERHASFTYASCFT